MKRLIVIILLLSYSQLSVLAYIVPPDKEIQPVCYGRAYSYWDLQKHPKQLVKRIMIKFMKGSTYPKVKESRVALKVFADIIDIDSNGNRKEFSFLGFSKDYRTTMGCYTNNQGEKCCSIDNDGGVAKIT